MNRRHHRQLPAGQLTLEGLFTPPPRPIPAAVGALDMALRLRETLAAVLHEAVDPATGKRMDRVAVSGQLTRLTGRDVSKNMLDRYCAPSADDWRFPAELIPALVKATGDYRLLELIAEACEARVVVGAEVWEAELGRIKSLKEELAEREAFATRMAKSIRGRR